MQSHPPRPPFSGRASPSRPGASAPWLLLAILAANHSAARAAPASLPYLAHADPAPLRHAPAPPRLPPPPPLASPAAPTSSSDPAPDPDLPAGADAPASATKGDGASPRPPDSAPPRNSPGPTPPAPILPDTYAPGSTVTVQDFLPFFLPASRPTSRAVYELR